MYTDQSVMLLSDMLKRPLQGPCLVKCVWKELSGLSDKRRYTLERIWETLGGPVVANLIEFGFGKWADMRGQ